MDVLMGRPATAEDKAAIANRCETGGISPLQLLAEMQSSTEHIRRCIDHAADLHLFLLHAARVKLVCTMLPAARVIVDVGGAAGSIYEMGYPYAFDRITVVDLPPQDRHSMYRDIAMKEKVTPNGPISILYTSMTDLRGISDHTVDMAWSGQSLEHITEGEADCLYGELRRILKNGGLFCLDTPNRNITEIHTTGWIHPEHKIEYHPEHLKRNLASAGFIIEQELGVCPMLQTWRTKTFHYSDFVIGGGLSSEVDSAYIQFYRCRLGRR
jgi:SAM-dependent methyltransferase